MTIWWWMAWQGDITIGGQLMWSVVSSFHDHYLTSGLSLCLCTGHDNIILVCLTRSRPLEVLARHYVTVLRGGLEVDTKSLGFITARLQSRRAQAMDGLMIVGKIN